jgi:DNA-binding transcriptional LysR family regulator
MGGADMSNWDDYRFFLAVARAGRITVAATTLGTDHSTVSRRIQALEQTLGASLFERSPRGYVLTAQGSQLLSAAETMESATLIGQAEVSGSAHAYTGSVRVASPEAFGSYFLGREIPKLLETHRGLAVQIVAMPSLFSLARREADVVVSLARPTAGRIHARKLTDYHLGLYAAPEYLERSPPLENVAQLEEHTFIGYDELVPYPEVNYLSEIPGEIKPRLTSVNLFTQLIATMAGYGLCVLPHFVAGHRTDLRPVFPGEICITRSYWLTVHSDMRALGRVRLVTDFLAEQVSLNRSMFVPYD